MLGVHAHLSKCWRGTSPEEGSEPLGYCIAYLDAVSHIFKLTAF